MIFVMALPKIYIVNKWYNSTTIIVSLVSISSTFLRTNFLYEHCFSSFFSYVLALAKNLYEKCAHKTLMKLTTVFPLFYFLEYFMDKSSYQHISTIVFTVLLIASGIRDRPRLKYIKILQYLCNNILVRLYLNNCVFQKYYTNSSEQF